MWSICVSKAFTKVYSLFDVVYLCEQGIDQGLLTVWCGLSVWARHSPRSTHCLMWSICVSKAFTKVYSLFDVVYLCEQGIHQDLLTVWCGLSVWARHSPRSTHCLMWSICVSKAFTKVYSLFDVVYLCEQGIHQGLLTVWCGLSVWARHSPRSTHCLMWSICVSKAFTKIYSLFDVVYLCEQGIHQDLLTVWCGLSVWARHSPRSTHCLMWSICVSKAFTKIYSLFDVVYLCEQGIHQGLLTVWCGLSVWARHSPRSTHCLMWSICVSKAFTKIYSLFYVVYLCEQGIDQDLLTVWCGLSVWARHSPRSTHCLMWSICVSKAFTKIYSLFYVVYLCEQGIHQDLLTVLCGLSVWARHSPRSTHCLMWSICVSKAFTKVYSLFDVVYLCEQGIHQDLLTVWCGLSVWARHSPRSTHCLMWSKCVSKAFTKVYSLFDVVYMCEKAFTKIHSLFDVVYLCEQGIHQGLLTVWCGLSVWARHSPRSTHCLMWSICVSKAFTKIYSLFYVVYLCEQGIHQDLLTVWCGLSVWARHSPRSTHCLMWSICVSKAFTKVYSLFDVV